MTQELKIDSFIWKKHNALTPEFCQNCIDKFEQDDRKTSGQFGDYCLVDTDIKRSVDLQISKKPGWEEETKVFYDSIASELNDYFEYIKSIHSSLTPFYDLSTVCDSGYQIQRTRPGEFYNWHTDACTENSKIRQLTYIWYLNDVCEDGYTEFIDGTRIQPETGKMIIFPATWTYLHRGYPPKSETKYIATGWIYNQLTELNL